MTIIKRRSASETWITWHTAFNSAQSNVRLEGSGAVDTASPSMFNNTFPTSTLITLGNGNFVNTNTETYVCYAFKSIEGYSKFSSYTGNGSTDGTFVYTGFRPAFVLVRSTGSGNWLMQDNKRLGYNSSNSELFANLTNAETTSDRADLLSNGFKAKQNSSENNSSGQEYIYMAFAENPFVTSTGKPVTAR